MQPYQMVKDLRTEVETGDVDVVFDGDLDQFMEGYLRWKRSEADDDLTGDRAIDLTARPIEPVDCRHCDRLMTIRSGRPLGRLLMIRLENVTKSYSADVVALRDASFDIAKGEFVFLVGPSGSGKSTMLRLLNRQERPERGAVWVAGRNIIDMPPGRVPHLRRNIGNIFQDYKLLSNKTVFENVAFAQEVIGQAEARHSPAGARRARPRRPGRQGRAVPAPALRW